MREGKGRHEGCGRGGCIVKGSQKEKTGEEKMNNRCEEKSQRRNTKE